MILRLEGGAKDAPAPSLDILMVEIAKNIGENRKEIRGKGETIFEHPFSNILVTPLANTEIIWHKVYLPT